MRIYTALIAAMLVPMHTASLVTQISIDEVTTSTVAHSYEPSIGKTYELCSITRGDGSTIGTSLFPCADASTKNGIYIRFDSKHASATIGSCATTTGRSHSKVCFELKNLKNLSYTIHSSASQE